MDFKVWGTRQYKPIMITLFGKLMLLQKSSMTLLNHISSCSAKKIK
jgi:hypothetical protein